MNKKFIFTLIFLSLNVMTLFALMIPLDIANELGDKIWKNECGGTLEGLTHWNEGENFGSFGIGHFIWHPKNNKEPFHETFPELLKFLQSQNVRLPAWLEQAEGCIWKSKEEFKNNLQSPQMVALRQMLYQTKDLQVIFIIERLEKALPQMTKNLTAKEKENVQMVFLLLSNDSRGLYALIDYFNFKGIGNSSSESYKGYGWGLLQVLQRLSPTSSDLVSDFAKAAKALLEQRVKNSPPERHEERWLKGWFNRIDTYIKY